MKKSKYITFFWVIFLNFITTSLFSQSEKGDSLRYLATRDSLYNKAIELRNNYQFSKSADLFQQLIEQATDSTEVLNYTDNKIVSQNGLAMSSFVATPKVISRKMFALSDFFLYYPLPDKSWRTYPSYLDSLAQERFPNVLYVPEGSQSLYYSSHDDSGARNIMYTEAGDSLWTVPALLNESLTSASNEIFPMLADGGKTLYFASDGLYGAGGYDLYSTTWDDDKKDWGEPQNLGFPYSSPYNDYLFVNTSDGKYTLFASDRGCSKDSVWLYVLEYDSLPVRQEVFDSEELKRICRLEPLNFQVDHQSDIRAEIPDNLDLKRYMSKISQVNELRDSIYALTVKRGEQKNDYAVSDDVEQRESLTLALEKGESAIARLQDSLEVAQKSLQKIEMEFLFSGVVIDPQKLMEEASKEVKSDIHEFEFVLRSMGDSLKIELEKPKVEFDWTFRIQDTSSIAQSNELPEGLVYQIQMITRKSKAPITSLKGISPIFEIPTSSGSWVYRAGLFNTYKAALSKLNIVKRKGFRNAKIVAAQDGKPISISAARSIETQLAQNPDLFEVAFAGERVGAELLEEIMALTGKDVAKGEREGKIMYIVGPFDKKADADMVSSYLNNAGVEQVLQNKLSK